ncbi:MAG: PEP/pyruvate-binding domain-containing protein [Nanoarchaeota archaeon]
MANVVWLKDVTSEEIGIIGLKASRLNLMYQNNFTVPFSFIVTIQSYQYFLDNKSLLKDIKKILSNSTNEKESILNASESIQELILNCDLPDSIKEDVIYAYSHMNMDTDIIKMLNKNALNFIRAGREFPYVALRPSFNVKGLKGKYFLNVKGKDNLIYSIKHIWASVFNPDNIQAIKGLNFENLGIAIIAQKMINSEKYAIVNVNNNEVNINCVYGLGESLSIAMPDFYSVNSSTLELINKIQNRQDVMLIRDDNYGRTVRKALNKDIALKEKLSSDEIRRLSNFSLSLYNLFNKEINIEIAMENGKLYLIDVNDEPMIKYPQVSETQEPILQDVQASQISNEENKGIFEMFSNNNVQSIDSQQDSYSPNESSDIGQSYISKSPTFGKVPISFDIKITDSTDIEEIKAKLKAIKEFINQEF